MEEKKKPPPYGAQEYWEQRYQENNVALAAGKETENSDASSEDDNPSPFHSWYFSYDELKPLLLPLILGGREEMQKIMGDSSTEIQEEAEKKSVNNDQQNDKKDVPASNVARKSATETTSEKKVIDSEDSREEDGQNEESEIDEDSTDDNQHDEDEWEEVHGNEDTTDYDEKGIDEEEEVSQSLSCGLAVKYPISVLEIGCGDVPLGIDLADDLLDLEMKTGADAGLIVKQIVSTDYSATLIDMMKRLAEKKRREPEPAQEEEDRPKLKILQEKQAYKHKKLPVEFSVADARELPYPAESFHLILEKGTLDAMLSDSKVGVKNCIMIVSECARVLAFGGQSTSWVRSVTTLLGCSNLLLFLFFFRLFVFDIARQCSHSQGRRVAR